MCKCIFLCILPLQWREREREKKERERERQREQKRAEENRREREREGVRASDREREGQFSTGSEREKERYREGVEEKEREREREGERVKERMFFFSDGMLHEYDLEIVKNNKWRFSNQNDNNVSEEAFTCYFFGAGKGNRHTITQLTYTHNARLNGHNAHTHS